MSPLETLFRDALLRWSPDLSAVCYEYPVLRYRLDFAMPALMRGCELDGYTYHEGMGRQKATEDKQRERDLDRAGWKLTRFSGDEIRADPDRCAKEWLEICGVFPRAVRRLPPEEVLRESQEESWAEEDEGKPWAEIWARVSRTAAWGSCAYHWQRGDHKEELCHVFSDVCEVNRVASLPEEQRLWVAWSDIILCAEYRDIQIHTEDCPVEKALCAHIEGLFLRAS